MKVVQGMKGPGQHLRAVLVQVTIDGQQVVSQAVGESMTGVPATTDMHFRNGAVAESYMSTLLLMLVDEKKVSLDDKVAKWLPDLPHADDVTLGQFVQMTCGYVDYEQLPEFTAANYAEPFKLWTPKELLSYAVGKPLWYTPGTGLNYAHTKLCDPGVGTGENHRAEPEHRAAGKSPGAVGAARHDRSGGNGRHQFRPAAFPRVVCTVRVDGSQRKDHTGTRLRTRLLRAERRLYLRARCGDHRQLVAPGSVVLRRVRGGGLPAVPEGCDRRAGDPRPGVLRFHTGAYSNVADQLWREIALQVAPSESAADQVAGRASETEPFLRVLRRS